MKKPKTYADLAEQLEPKKKTLYTHPIDNSQMKKLEEWLNSHLWAPYKVDYSAFAYKNRDTNVVAYKSGKLVVQGKGTEDFVMFVLEPEIFGVAEFGYEEARHPEWYEAHAGIDESGKGDLFGPLVSACVIADAEAVRQWQEDGLKESKRVSSDKAALGMAKKIRDTKGVVVKVSYANMAKYNDLYRRFGNLNKMLAWMHAKAIEGALAERHVPWGMLDQFTKQPLVQRQLKTDGTKDFNLKMQTKAEEDPVVAAASIIARATYIFAMQKLSKQFGEDLMKGASAKTKAQAVAIIKKFGADALPNFAKMHFKTAQEALKEAAQ
ncbi:MAG: ribonuclease HIII [Opitutales bacterium]|nr:ribonuclease HIII [Opitutales bacterium]